MGNIILLGLVSFFADLSSEMVYPIIPLYLTAAFGATPALVGVIEGIAESVASLLKVYSGYLTDKYKHKKPLAFLGYATGLLYKIALLFAGSWVGILGARVLDRLGKGIRTAPRDVMVSESAGASHMGAAFGIHKALDMAGSAAGILAAYFLLRHLGGDAPYQRIFLLSLLPAVLGLSLFFFIHEKKEPRQTAQRPPILTKLRALDGRLKLYLLVVLLFTLGNSSNTFLLLRAKSVGFTDENVILLYLLYNVVASLLSLPLGGLSDKIGRKWILVAGYLTFSLVYFGFAFVGSSAMMIAIFAVYGVFTALTAGVERAFLTELAPPALRGTVLGLHGTLVGVALLPASALAGILWDTLGARAPFLYGGVLSLLSALILALFLKPSRQTADS